MVGVIRTACSSSLGGGEEPAFWRIGVEATSDREPFSNKALRCHCVQEIGVSRLSSIVVRVVWKLCAISPQAVSGT